MVIIPSGYVKIAIENGPVEIVDFPIGSFHSYVKVYQRDSSDSCLILDFSQTMIASI